MDSIHSQFLNPTEIITTDKEKIRHRTEAILKNVNNFIKKSGLENDVSINELVLSGMILDYFTDINRLKEFHHVEHVNNYRIVAYTSYWFLQRKPIQINTNSDKKLLYINERYILTYILNFLSDEKYGEIITREEDELNAFCESLFYFLKYRCDSAKDLEMLLLSFNAGRIYQNKNE